MTSWSICSALSLSFSTVCTMTAKSQAAHECFGLTLRHFSSITFAYVPDEQCVEKPISENMLCPHSTFVGNIRWSITLLAKYE
jgi:hypothetical protein